MRKDHTVEVVIYVADVDFAQDEQAMEKLVGAVEMLPWKDRIEKVRRQKTPYGRMLQAGAGFLLFEALALEGVKDFEMGENEHGKPYLKNDSVSFNLSHSGSKVICAVCKEDIALGADIEPLREGKKKLYDRLFPERERRWADERFGVLNNNDEAFTRLWTLKESYLKMKGTGFADDVYGIDLSKTDEHYFFDVYEGYYISLCSNRKIITVFKPIMLDKCRFYGYK